MKRILTALIFTSFGLGSLPAQAEMVSEARSGGSGRIVGGTMVAPGAGPWAVRLNIVIDGDDFICGATLVEPELETSGGVRWASGIVRARYAITAGHCVWDNDRNRPIQNDSIMAVTGQLDLTSNTGEVRRVEAIIPHPDFDPVTLDNDIALLKLSATDGSVQRRSVRQSIRLPDVGDTHWIAQEYLALIAQGWGRTAENGASTHLLQEVRLPLVDRQTCAERFAIHGVDLHPGNICAGFVSGGFDSCNGDSGGPLLFRPNPDASVPVTIGAADPVLVGAVSWGIGCARQDLFGVYTSIAHHRRWLDEVAEACLTGSAGSRCD